MAEFLSFLRSLAVNGTQSNSPLESRLQVLTRLKFIASIEPHEKIDSRLLRVENNTIFTPIKRLFFGDSRDTTLFFLSSTVNRVFELISAHLHSNHVSDSVFCTNILRDLIHAIKGLRSFQTTYADDKLVVCEIEVLIESISSKIFEIQKSHPQLFPTNELP